VVANVVAVVETPTFQKMMREAGVRVGRLNKRGGTSTKAPGGAGW